MNLMQDDSGLVTSKVLQAFMLYFEEGLESVKRIYPEYYSFVEENKHKTYRQIKKELSEASRVFA